MLFFGASLNAIPWCYAPEIIPLQARAKGTSLAVCWNWIFVRIPHLLAFHLHVTNPRSIQVFTIVMVAPTMIANIAWKTYLVFMACVCDISPRTSCASADTNLIRTLLSHR